MRSQTQPKPQPVVETSMTILLASILLSRGQTCLGSPSTSKSYATQTYLKHKEQTRNARVVLDTTLLVAAPASPSRRCRPGLVDHVPLISTCFYHLLAYCNGFAFSNQKVKVMLPVQSGSSLGKTRAFRQCFRASLHMLVPSFSLTVSIDHDFLVSSFFPFHYLPFTPKCTLRNGYLFRKRLCRRPWKPLMVTPWLVVIPS